MRGFGKHMSRTGRALMAAVALSALGGAIGAGVAMANPVALPWGGPLQAPVRQGRSVPFTPPVSMVNGLSLRAFNAAYHAMGRFKAGRGPVHYQPFFYPLVAAINVVHARDRRLPLLRHQPGNHQRVGLNLPSACRKATKTRGGFGP